MRDLPECDKHLSVDFLGYHHFYQYHFLLLTLNLLQ